MYVFNPITKINMYRSCVVCSSVGFKSRVLVAGAYQPLAIELLGPGRVKRREREKI